MLRVFWNSKSAMMASQEKLDTISNNLSNVNTDGYKRVDVSFKDLMSETLVRNGYPISENENRKNDPFTGTGVRASELVRDTKQGNLYETKETTDLAIDGEGYFRVTMPNGDTAYTRSGKLGVDADGKLVDASGNILNINFNDGFSADNVKFTRDNFSILKDGTLIVKEGANDQQVGKISLYNAIGSESMKSIGDNLYTPSADAQVYEVPSSDSDILQGFTEGSNVDMVKEMTDLMITQRAFELGSKGLKTADEMWGMVNNLKSR